MLMIGSGCAARTCPTVTIPAAHYQSIIMHADTEFNVGERADIDRAASIWYDMTGGKVRIRVEYDLDFYNASSLRVEKMIIRAPETSPLVQAVNPKALGFVVDDKRMYLVPSRWYGRGYEVVTHEFGHILGMDDNMDNRSALMHVSYYSGQCLSVSDIEEFCKHHGCIR